MRLNFRRLTPVLLIGAGLLLAACSGDDPTATATSAPANTRTQDASVGTVDVRVTDQANGEITAIVITANNLRANKSSQEDDNGWIPVIEGEHTFDLLQVVGKEASLGIGTLEPGTYNQVRMDIVSVVITRDGVDIEGEVPSSVLRIVRPFDVIAGETTILTFDFNADRSVVSAGQRLLLRPVVKLMVRKGSEPFVPEPFASDSEAPGATPTPGPTATPTPTPAPDVFVLHIDQPVEAETISETANVTIVGRTRADAAITVGDTFLTPDIDGIFSIDLTLAEGVNVIEVVASIANGEELSEVLTILYLP